MYPTKPFIYQPVLVLARTCAPAARPSSQGKQGHWIRVDVSRAPGVPRPQPLNCAQHRSAAGSSLCAARAAVGQRRRSDHASHQQTAGKQHPLPLPTLASIRLTLSAPHTQIPVS